MSGETLGTNGPEAFGVYPGDPGYDTFDKDYPTSNRPVTNYDEADFEMGELRRQEPPTHPETAEEEEARVNRWLRNRYSNQ